MGKTLAEYPELLLEWDKSKNFDLSPKEIKFKSSKKFWWKCSFGHEWFTTVECRTRGKNCPFCCKQKVCISNCLETTNFEVAQEWYPSKNGNLTPRDIVAGSNKKVWWKCSFGHEWQASISNRTHGKTNCPYCCGQKTCSSNCLLTIRPDIAKEWHLNKNNLTPKDVSSCSGKSVWRECIYGHIWEAVIAQRTSYNSGCPHCNESKGEKEIKRILEISNFNFIPQAKFDGCKFKNKLSFDFLVLKDNQKYLIEYNGVQHYEPVGWYGTKKTNKSLELIIIRDKIKSQWCWDNQIPLLVIPYWDFYKIEKLIFEFFKRA